MAVTVPVMTMRAQILLLTLLPLAVLAVFAMTAVRIPVPEIGRGYVVHIELPVADTPEALLQSGHRRGHGLGR